MSDQIIKEFTHHEIDQDIYAIGGHYTLTKEERLPFKAKYLLYMTGYAVFDTTCCGSGGCGYAIVPGFVSEWKIRKDEQGRFISKVEPINDPIMQKEIESLLKAKEMVQEVRFE
jgi:hypothetical protein